MVRDWHGEARRQSLQARSDVAAAIAEEELLHQRYREHRTRVKRWQQRAELAIAKGLEDLARQALERRRNCQALADAYWTEYETQRLRVAALKRELQEPEAGGTPVHGRWAGAPLERAGQAAGQRQGRPMDAAARAAFGFEANGLQADPVADRLAAMEREELLERQLAELKARLARDAEA